MAEIITVARPYAEAVYSLAAEQKSLDDWSSVLAGLAAIMSHPGVIEAATSPRSTDIEALLWDKLGESACDEVKRFVAMLIERKRLLLLPKIAQQFEQLKAQAEGLLDATIETAVPLTEQQQTELMATLSKKYSKVVRLEIRDAPDLLSGVRVLIGDDVIDASVRGKLQTMAASLKN